MSVGNYNSRALTLSVMVVLLGIIFILKLFFIQVQDESYKFSADSNTQRIMTQYPARGLIYDRTGKLLVSNQPVYDIMIVPRDVEPFDTTDFCLALNLERDALRKMFTDLRKNIRSRKVSSYKPSVFMKQVSAEQYGVFQEKLYKYKGFYAQRRTLRKYEYPNAAHVLGYIGEVNDAMIKKDPYYVQGDYAGISGIEQTYESYLRGVKGAKVLMVDVHGREKGSYRDGRFDTVAVVGKDITMSLDIELQVYGELLMQNKIGSVVAIEPSTGEILAMISAPSYDPSLMVGRIRSGNFQDLNTDPNKPLINRALQALYPPGSTFKTVNALIGLQEGVLTEDTRFPCSRGYHLGGLTVGCHAHPGPLNLPQSIQHSCNGYYSAAFRKILDNPKYHSPKVGLDKWKEYCVNFGLGYRLGVDFANENRGFIPNSEYYNKAYRGAWNSVTVISLGIGQAEILLTPIQMANVATAICNRGYFFTPHAVKSIDGDTIDGKYRVRHETGIAAQNFIPILDGMESAVWGDDGGTARVAQIDSVRLCGKTGTAQNPHGEDHSMFIAFAPRENPKIAIAVCVENAGFGAAYAAPVASLMIEKYLKGHISEKRKVLEERMVTTNLLGNETR